MSILLAQANTIIKASLAKGRDLGLKPLSVVVLDERASLVACMSEDGVSQMRQKSRMARQMPPSPLAWEHAPR